MTYSCTHLSTSIKQIKLEADRLHRCEYALREVRRWTSIQKAVAQSGLAIIGRLEEQLLEHNQAGSYEIEAVKAVEQRMHLCQEQNQDQLHQADNRLRYFRHILLTKGTLSNAQ